MAQWGDLPYEIQELILDHLFHQTSPISSNKGGPVGRPLNRRTPACIGYLTTCKTWRRILEPRIYRHLFLTSSSLSVLKRLSLQHQNLVQYVWLAIEMQEHDCSDCIRPDPKDIGSYTRRRVDRAVAVHALCELFHVMSAWRRKGSAGVDGLTLEISVFCKSDMDHAFWNHLHCDSSPFTPPGELEIDRPRHHDSIHGWRNGQLTRPHGVLSIIDVARAMEREVGCLELLRPVPAVTTFVLRRQTRRGLPLNTLQAIVEKLPNLTSMAVYQSGILSLPSTAKNLVLFEDFNEDYSRIITTDPETADWSYRPGLHRTPSPLVADVLVSLVQIEKLAASYLVDAYDFFLCAGHRTSFWWRLSSLYLTSPHLVPETDRRCIDFILTLAGCVAERMPVLDTMVIWYGAKGVASEFRYEVTAKGRHASVRWRGTFDHPLATDTLKAWQRVARLRGAELTEKESVLLKAGEVYSHGAAIAELGLGGHVIHPVSLEQICGETSRYWFK